MGRDEELGRNVGQGLQLLQRRMERIMRAAGVAGDVEGAEGVDKLPAESK